MSYIEAESTLLLDSSNENKGFTFRETEGSNRSGTYSSYGNEQIKEVLEESLKLHDEINTIFTEFSDLNRQVRIDINEFCKIREGELNSITNVTNPSSAKGSPLRNTSTPNNQ